LLADKNTQILEYVRRFLTTKSCEVVGVVTDGQAAVDAAARLLPDVLVLDFSLPILNGVQAARRVREANPSVKIVFHTVYNDRDICRAALETDASGYVLKPRLASDLILAIELARDGRHFVSCDCD